MLSDRKKIIVIKVDPTYPWMLDFLDQEIVPVIGINTNPPDLHTPRFNLNRSNSFRLS